MDLFCYPIRISWYFQLIDQLYTLLNLFTSNSFYAPFSDNIGPQIIEFIRYIDFNDCFYYHAFKFSPLISE